MRSKERGFHLCVCVIYRDSSYVSTLCVIAQYAASFYYSLIEAKTGGEGRDRINSRLTSSEKGDTHLGFHSP